jgi:hypothetical protein
MQSLGFPCHGGDRRYWTPDKWNRLVAFPPAPKRLVEGHQLDACYPLGDNVLCFEFKLLSLGIQDVEKVR